MTSALSVSEARANLGPSFACPAPNDPLAQLICSNLTLAMTELRFVQAYQTLRFQSTPVDRVALRGEAQAFNTAVRNRCGIPAVGVVNWQPSDPGAWLCVQREFSAQQARWFDRLGSQAREEARRSLREHVELQAALQRTGYLPASAPADGVYGPATRTAIQAWQVASGRTPTGLLTDNDALALTAPASGGRMPIAAVPSLPPRTALPPPIKTLAPSTPSIPAHWFLVGAITVVVVALLLLPKGRKPTAAPPPPVITPFVGPDRRPAQPVTMTASATPTVHQIIKPSVASKVWVCPECNTNNSAKSIVCEVCAAPQAKIPRLGRV